MIEVSLWYWTRVHGSVIQGVKVPVRKDTNAMMPILMRLCERGKLYNRRSQRAKPTFTAQIAGR